MAGQQDTAPTAVTRYLCAGAYLDEEFARAVLDEVVADPHRGVAPAPGVDVETVARHCLAAVRRNTRRDVVTCVILLAVAVVAGLRGVLVVTWLCSTLLLARSVRSLVRSDLSTAVSQFLIFLLISVACGFGLLTQLLRDRSGLLPEFNGSRLLPVDSTTLVILVGLALWAMAYLDRVGQYGLLTETLAPGRFAADPSFPVTSDGESARLAYVGAAQGSPLSVYAASAGPFVGLGRVVHAWTASCRLQPAGGDPPSAAAGGPDVAGVHRALRENFVSVGERLLVGDLVAVPGWVARSHPFVEDPPLRPVSDVPPAVVADIAARPAGTETHYLLVHVPSPTGETAVSGLVHVESAAGLLTVDVALTALPPVDARYRSVDAVRPGGGLLVGQMLGAAALDIFRVVPRAPAGLWRTIRRALPRLAPRGATAVDLGARAGVRELAAAPVSGQVQDFEATRAANLVSRTVVETVSGLLESHGLSSTDFVRTADPVWHKPLTAPTDALAARTEP